MKAVLFFVGGLLVATTGFALTTTRTETRLEDFRVLLLKQPGDPAFLVSYRTYDDQGMLRDLSNQDYWQFLTATQKSQVRAVIDGAYQKAHTVNEIPMPSPTPVATPAVVMHEAETPTVEKEEEESDAPVPELLE